MDSFVYVASICVLVVVIITQAVERYFFAEHVREEQSRFISAILSKDTQEYAQLLREEKIKPEKKQAPEEIPLSELDDPEWYKTVTGKDEDGE